MKKLTALSFLVLLLVSAALLPSCAKDPKKQILGTWLSKDSLISTEYEFKEEGVGSMTTLGATVPTKYTISEGIIYITYSILGVETTETFILKFEENSMLLMDSAGFTEEFVKS